MSSILSKVVKVDVAAALYLLWAGKNTTPELEAMLLRIPTPEQNNTKIRTWYRWTAPEVSFNAIQGHFSNILF